MKNNWKKIAAMALTLSIGISAIAAPVSAKWVQENNGKWWYYCLLYTSPSPRD